ncbi:hypothetical protein GMD78_12415 [Ornithinibacillus sp. L9]|uniref:Uncharacterized protein n=1 Tax=Ornithinibacillus caprae TaxID=2678566 RepID=A0A6N8FME6_9BACI|nr:hypothetical protein [Ornithinibacillus caprae]MUK89177.1 hypothetical protein [Ornithinibacillus caprae]
MQIVGLNISVKSVKETTEIPKNEKSNKKTIRVKVNDQDCDLCKGEDMFIAGTKNLIPCPNCKRNTNKFNKILI